VCIPAATHVSIQALFLRQPSGGFHATVKGKSQWLFEDIDVFIGALKESRAVNMSQKVHTSAVMEVCTMIARCACEKGKKKV